MGEERQSSTGRWFGRLKRIVPVLFVVAILGLVANEARSIDWNAVVSALRGYRPATLLMALALSVPGQLAVAGYDLIGKKATGHDLPARRVMLISYTGYFLSLNVGALIGGVAFRYRLYAPYKLRSVAIGQIIALSILTNWSGYVLFAGALLVYEPPQLPESWGAVGAAGLRLVGAAMLATMAAYLTVCGLRGGTRIEWRGHELELPTPWVAAVQILLSLVSWGSIGAILACLLPSDIGWFAVMPVLMISAMAGVWSHVPGGLGVIEFVFLALLGHSVGRGNLLATILVFRAIYYVTPLAAAVAGYFYLEATARRFEPRA